PVIPIVLTSEKPADKLKEITDRLEQGIMELFDSDRYKEYLRVMSKFHNYSFNNTLLIAMQKPDASLVAGFQSWKNNFKRNVVKGEKGIKILAPSPFKIKQEMEKIDPATQKPVIGADGKPVKEEKEITIPAFKVVSVFDVSQTEGKELPDIAVDMLTGDVECFKDVFAALEKTSPVPIGFEKIEGNSHGYYHLEEKRIAIDEGMSELQTIKTAIHEIAHAKLHDIDPNAPKEERAGRPDRRTREVQAESVAYAVCQHYGLDTSDYSFGYVAGWSSGRELDELKSSLET
ncbi:LtrC-like protein, partial [human gut metagenome]